MAVHIEKSKVERLYFMTNRRYVEFRVIFWEEEIKCLVAYIVKIVILCLILGYFYFYDIFKK